MGNPVFRLLPGIRSWTFDLIDWRVLQLRLNNETSIFPSVLYLPLAHKAIGTNHAKCFLLVSAVSGPFTSRLVVCICFSWFSRSEVCAFVLGNICERFARRDLC